MKTSNLFATLLMLACSGLAFSQQVYSGFSRPKDPVATSTQSGSHRPNDYVTPAELYNDLQNLKDGQIRFVLLSVREGKDLTVRPPTYAERADSWLDRQMAFEKQIKADPHMLPILNEKIEEHINKLLKKARAGDEEAAGKLKRYLAGLRSTPPSGMENETSCFALRAWMVTSGDGGITDGYYLPGTPQVVSAKKSRIETYGFRKGNHLVFFMVWWKAKIEDRHGRDCWGWCMLCGNDSGKEFVSGVEGACLWNFYCADKPVEFCIPGTPPCVPPSANASARASANASVTINMMQTWVPIAPERATTLLGYGTSQMIGSAWLTPRHGFFIPPPSGGGSHQLPGLPLPGGGYPYYQRTNRPELDYNLVFGNGNSGPPWATGGQQNGNNQGGWIPPR